MVAGGETEGLAEGGGHVGGDGGGAGEDAGGVVGDAAGIGPWRRRGGRGGLCGR